jgi:hypothetical protein
MNRFIRFGVIVLLLVLAVTSLVASPSANSASTVIIKATLTIPIGLTGLPGDTLDVPLFMSTEEAIGIAQMVIEFDQKDFTFVTAAIGPDAAARGFGTLVVNADPPVPVTTPGATDNALVQISGGGVNTLSGSDLKVLLLKFRVNGTSGGSSPFAFNPAPSATFLTTDRLVDLKGEDLQLINGSGNIASLATLSIPGGFSIPQAETLFVPVMLSSEKPIGVAQLVLDYDGNDLQFLEATLGPDGAGFTMLVNPAPSFAPQTAGTNKNLLVSLYSGSLAISGKDKAPLTLAFVAVGQVGGNSPIAFDRRPHHTVLATTELVDLTGSDLTFQDGDATILPPLLDVSGKVIYKLSGALVSGAVLEISGQVKATNTTNAAGVYLFRKISEGSYVLRPSKTGDTRGAIQGSDALLVFRTTALIDTLAADQKRSADVTQDGLITVSDGLAILRYLALQTTGIAQVGAWVFEPESVTVLVQSDTTKNFAALLLGDVNGNWSQSSGMAKTLELPFASIRFGQLREDRETSYLPLFAGNEGTVFTLLTTFELPPNLNDQMRFVPSEPHILAVTNSEAKQKWHLALVTINGIGAEQKIGELVMSRSATASLRNWRVARAEVNDRLMKLDELQFNAEDNAAPVDFELQQNFPNPFNAATWIVFGIPAHAGETEVRLDIFTADGKLVRAFERGKYAPGTHRVLWDGRDEVGASAPSGVYFYRIQAGGFSASRKLVLIK